MPFGGGGTPLPLNRVWSIIDSGTVSGVTSFSTNTLDPTIYDRMIIYYRLTSSASAGSLTLRVNNDSTANDYVGGYMVDGTLTFATAAQMFLSKIGHASAGCIEIVAKGATEGTNSMFIHSVGRTTSSSVSWSGSCVKNTGVNVTTIQLIGDQANALSGEYIVYGLSTGL